VHARPFDETKNGSRRRRALRSVVFRSHARANLLGAAGTEGGVAVMQYVRTDDVSADVVIETDAGSSSDRG